jgi:hypothetical protein
VRYHLTDIHQMVAGFSVTLPRFRSPGKAEPVRSEGDPPDFEPP